ncbi:hypothetical protein [Streptomyces paromomycinus]|uniref:Lipoprotein n=1 Tax=Streptomyces paromomycinus TaxID=92743 RepID=A0A401W8L8_STREY|nr:hypothetical protein [Streptomyces paromomycinus]GCD45651.1 hypothetical protein GKJPGBOP_05388 [Streptomyces paromomycinus]
MRRVKRFGSGTVGCVAAALLLVALSACQRDGSGSAANGDGNAQRNGSGNGSGGAATASPSPAATFLAPGTCSSRGRTVFYQVSCRSERAAALVLSRYDGPQAQGPLCPERTDFVLHISERRPASDKTSRENGDGAVPQGYACMRNLEAPHPGDPGGGGGPRTIVGDCVRPSRQGEVKETACDGSGAHAPQFTVTAAVRTRAACPADTDLYVQLGGGAPVGCARRL